MVLRGTGDINPVPSHNTAAGVLPTPSVPLNSYNSGATSGGSGGDPTSTTGTSSSPDSQNKCRAQCGFFAGEASTLGFCSKCFTTIKDDYYLCAVVGANVGNPAPVTQFLSVGGSARREVEENEATQLSKMGVYVVKGHNLVDIASHRDHSEVIALLISSLEESEITAQADPGNNSSSSVAGGFVASKPISALIVTPPHRSRQPAGTPPASLTLPSTSDEAGKTEQQVLLGGKNVNEILDNDELLQLQLEQDAESLLENVRLEILSTTDIREDGLVHFWTAHPRFKLVRVEESATERTKRGRTSSAEEVGNQGASSPLPNSVVGRSFALPASLESLDWKKRNQAMSQFLEQPVMMEDIHKAIDFFPLVPGCSEFVPLYTAADLNCLLHGCFTSMCAVRDDMLASEDPNASTVNTRTVLRDAVYNSLSNCLHLQQVVTAGVGGRMKEMLKDASHKASLDGGHCFALANVLRRPIIVYAHKDLEGAYREDLKAPFRVSGIYLPLLWDPPVVRGEGGEETDGAATTTVRDPLVLCYSQGHFSSLVGFTPSSSEQQQQPSLVVPLCDETLGPLPIHFSQASPQYAESETALPLPECVLEDLALKQSEQMIEAEEADAAPSAATPALTHQHKINGNTKKELEGGGCKRFGHNEVELSLLRAYLRGVEISSLGDGESEEELQITTCQQQHLMVHDDSSATCILSDLYEPTAMGDQPLEETFWWKYTSTLTNRINEKVTEVMEADKEKSTTEEPTLTK